jgi:hypothetical protein
MSNPSMTRPNARSEAAWQSGGGEPQSPTKAQHQQRRCHGQQRERDEQHEAAAGYPPLRFSRVLSEL